MTVHHINRECNYIDRLKETLEIAHDNDYVVVGIETKVLERMYEDLLVIDIERIQRAKEIINSIDIDSRTKREARGLINTYKTLANEFKESKDEDKRERAETILHELCGI